MKKLFSILFVMFAVFQLTGCDNVRNGYVGVKVERFGDNRGVNNEVLGPGRYYVGPNTDIYEFPTFSITDTFAKKPEKDESISFQSKEGMTINADFGTTFSIKRDNVSKVFQKYRRGVDEISDVFLRNMIKDALIDNASKRTIEELMNDKVKFVDDVQADVVKRAEASGITVETISTLGEFRWPPQIITAINAKMTATQDAMKVENELRKTRAEAEKKVVEADAQVRVAIADAKAIESRGQALARNPSVLQQQAIEKWDGKTPIVIGSGQSVMGLPANLFGGK